MNTSMLALVAALSLLGAGTAGAEPEKRNTVIRKKPVEATQVDNGSTPQTPVALAESTSAPRSPPTPGPNGPRTRKRD